MKKSFSFRNVLCITIVMLLVIQSWPLMMGRTDINVYATTFGEFTIGRTWDSKVSIIGYTGPGGDVFIPTTIGGEAVAAIGSEAFRGCEGITSISLPPTLETIGYRAFYQCEGLKNITIPEGVTEIRAEAFVGCSSMTYASIPSSVSYIGDYAFASCISLSNITLPPYLNAIHPGTFFGCSNLVSVNIPDGVWYIGTYAFCGCSSLRSINLPDEVTSIGGYAFCGCSSLTDIVIPYGNEYIGDYTFSGCSNLINVNIQTGVTYIGTQAFSQCTKLTNVILPYTLKTIGWGAFSDCISLASVDIPDGVEIIGSCAFDRCSNLTSIIIPNSVTEIWHYAFAGCNSLTSVIIPSSVTIIGDCPFNSCSNLTNITVQSGNLQYSSTDGVLYNLEESILIQYPGGKTGSFSIPESVTSIGENAFQQCGKLTSVTTPSSVTDIGMYAFEACSNLTSITIPDSVVTIGYEAFGNCRRLTSIDIPSSVTTLDGTFVGCSGLTSINLPNSVTTLNSTFNGCSGLTSINIPNSVTTLDGTFVGCSGLTSINLPNSVTTLNSTFNGCSGLASIAIPNSVTSIGEYTFDNCNSLNSITIPPSVISIGYHAFASCSSLTSITVPSSVTSIGDWCFYDCSSLQNALFMGDAPTIGDCTFYGCTDTFKVYYLANKTGYTNPWHFYTTATFNSEDKYTLIFNSQGGSVVEPITIYDGASVNAPSEPTRDNYTFASWYKEIDCINAWDFETDKVTADTTLYAKWAINKNKVTFNSLGGSTIESLDVEYDNTIITPSEPSKTGYYFVGWYKDEECTNSWDFSTDRVTSDTTLYAKWNPNLIYGTDGDFEFEITEGSAMITSYIGDGGAVTIPSTITIDTMTYDVTSIGNYAFSQCSTLLDISIPNSVTSIGAGAFQSTGLTNITIPDDVTSIGDWAFDDCTNLTNIIVSAGNPNYASENGVLYNYDKSIVVRCPEGKAGVINIPSTVTAIGYWAFYDCNSLTSIVIPNSVTSIGEGSFGNCTGLTSISLPNSITCIEGYAFIGCTNLISVNIPDSVATIGFYAFSGCSDLTSITIPSRLTIIWEGTFSGCSNLVSINIADSVVSIGDAAFYGCSSLTGITIPSSVTSIGFSAFDGCLNLNNITISDGNTDYSSANGMLCNYAQSTIIRCPEGKVGAITIPSSVTNISYYAFCGCDKLTSITIPSSVTSIGEGAFSACSNLQSINIPNSVNSIGDEAFYGCSSLTSITIPNSLTSIGWGTFRGCSSLNSIVIPDSVTAIGDLAFTWCIGLTNITIPDSVTKIGAGAFEGCDNLANVTIPASVTSIGDYAFENFEGNGKLRAVYFLGDAPTMGENVFDIGYDGQYFIVDGLTMYYLAGSSGFTNPWQGYPTETFAIGEQYDVTFNSQGGSTVGSVTADYNTSISAPISPTRTGYTFAGWYKESACTNAWNFTTDKVMAATTLYAKWTPNTYTIAFNGNGATSGSMISLAMTYDVSKTLTSNVYTKTGYTFSGWATSPTGAVAYANQAAVKNLTGTNNGTATLYAKWTPNTYTIAFNGNGATSGSMTSLAMTYDVSKTLTSNVYTKTGYTFSGWATSPTGAVSYANQASVKNLTATKGAAVTLYAKWIPNTYNIKFNTNGGTSGTMASLAMTYDSSKALTANTFKKTGYSFLGWATSSTGAVVYKDLASVKNLTTTKGATVNLYAKWGAAITSVTSYNYTSIKVSWAYAGSATSYKVYRATSATGTYTLVYTASSTARSWVDTGQTTGKYYYYKVYPVAGGKTYAFSTYKYAKAIPTTPSVTLTKASSTSIKITWTGVSGATKYQVYRATSATGTYSYLYTASSTARYWVNTGLTAGKTYYYKVRAYHLEGTTNVYGSLSAVKYLKF